MMFTVAFPLAPLFALINVHVEKRLDAYKLAPGLEFGLHPLAKRKATAENHLQEDISYLYSYLYYIWYILLHTYYREIKGVLHSKKSTFSAPTLEFRECFR